jgi:hypothetical protein
MTEEIKTIEILIEKLEKSIAEKDKNWDYGRPYEDYLKHIENESKQIGDLDRRRRFIMPYELEELSGYGDLMSLETFVSNVESGCFIDYDGYGVYVKDGKQSNIDIYPSDVKNNCIREDFSSVLWFNR